MNTFLTDVRSTIIPDPDGAHGPLPPLLLSMSLGMQNAAARKIAVPDLTTTVLTLTITGIAADSSLAGGRGSRAGRRLTAVIAMLAGALIGAALVLHARIYYPLGLAFLAILPIALMARVLGKPDRAWTHAPS